MLRRPRAAYTKGCDVPSPPPKSAGHCENCREVRSAGSTWEVLGRFWLRQRRSRHFESSGSRRLLEAARLLETSGTGESGLLQCRTNFASWKCRSLQCQFQGLGPGSQPQGFQKHHYGHSKGRVKEDYVWFDSKPLLCPAQSAVIIIRLLTCYPMGTPAS